MLHANQRNIILISALLLVVLAIFLRRPFDIDDPLFIWAARHIQTNPGNPYGFNVNWYGLSMPISDVAKNPPLASYFIALTALLLGWSEPALHFAFILAAIGVAIGTYFIAARLCGHPLVATLAAILTPVFIVSSLTVMSDVLMLTFFVFAVYLWMKGLDETNHLALALAGLFIAISAITKYFGVALIPLLLAYAVFKKRSLGWWLLYLGIPIAILAWYQWQTQRLYGRGLLLDAAAYATDVKSDFAKFPLAKTYVGFAFTGGCVATALFFGLQLWRRRVVIGGLILMGIAAFIFMNVSAVGPFKFPSDWTAHSLIAVQLGIWGISGVSLIALAAVDLYNKRDADSVLLFLWTIGTFLFAGFINWTVNGRSILPMTIPAGILIARRLELRGVPLNSTAFATVLMPLAAALILSFAVGWADTAFADAERTGAAKIHESYGNRRVVWFEGHWGFQYYMEQLGAKAVDLKGSRVAIGDVVVVPSINTNLFPLPPNWPVRSVFEVASTRWLSTMNPTLGAGFYTDVLGPLPFVISSIPPERFAVFEITQ